MESSGRFVPFSSLRLDRLHLREVSVEAGFRFIFVQTKKIWSLPKKLLPIEPLPLSAPCGRGDAVRVVETQLRSVANFMYDRLYPDGTLSTVVLKFYISPLIGYLRQCEICT